MKIRISLFTLFIFSSLAVKSQDGSANEKSSAEAAVTKLFEGLAELDTVKIRQACTPDIRLLENGQVWTIDTLIVGVNKRKSATDFKRINKLDFIETKIDGNTAWTSYYNQATISANGKTYIINWLESVVLRKENNSWKVDFLHSTVLNKKN